MITHETWFFSIFSNLLVHSGFSKYGPFFFFFFVLRWLFFCMSDTTCSLLFNSWLNKTQGEGKKNVDISVGRSIE